MPLGSQSASGVTSRLLEPQHPAICWRTLIIFSLRVKCKAGQLETQSDTNLNAARFCAAMALNNLLLGCLLGSVVQGSQHLVLLVPRRVLTCSHLSLPTVIEILGGCSHNLAAVYFRLKVLKEKLTSISRTAPTSHAMPRCITASRYSISEIPPFWLSNNGEELTIALT